MSQFSPEILGRCLHFVTAAALTAHLCTDFTYLAHSTPVSELIPV